MVDFQQARSPQEQQKEVEFQTIFGHLADGAFIYDRDERIRFINPAAIHFLGLTSEAECIGRPYRELIRLFEEVDGQEVPIDIEHEPLAHMQRKSIFSPIQARHISMQRTDGEKFHADVYYTPVLDLQGKFQRGICVIHPIQDQPSTELQAQQIIQALLSLMGIFSDLSDGGTAPEPALEIELLTSPDMQSITKSIVDLLRTQLASDYVWLTALDTARDQVNFVALSGFTKEQEQRYHVVAKNRPLSALLNIDRWTQIVTQGAMVLSGARLNLTMIEEIHAEHSIRTALYIPLFGVQQAIGCLVIGKNTEVTYSLAEIKLVKAMASLIILILRQFALRTQLAQVQAREQTLRETNQRMNAFLDLASHELRTPLTILMGNLQLAQRRLQQGAKAATAAEASHLHARALQALEDAVQGARIQERMLNDMLDDSLIQTNMLVLHTQMHDLRTLVRDAVAIQQKLVPERSFVLDLAAAEVPMMVMADAARIQRVVSTYLRQAHAYSPPDRPIVIRMCIEIDTARVEVQDEGWGIPPEVQPLIWKRFYRTTGLAVQHELDLSLGLGLYLCRAFIQLHHGTVGMESVPGAGSTFWFTLPLLNIRT